MSDADLPDRSGTLLAGRYRLTHRLGVGGMGEVYRATNEAVNREVAIKILKPELAKDPNITARVLREARAANTVRHPSVVDVLDVATDEHGAPFIVQELLTGTDLSHHLIARGGALTEAEALEVMTPVCEAIGLAHAAGIMHRDLKPENVFMAQQPGGAVIPKVLDFGLSRDVGEEAVSRLTATGVAMGTPMYMSPEQVQGQRDVDQRTDVWALGVMLQELVSGKLPFAGDSLGAIFVKICTNDPEPLRTVAPGVSDGYVSIVEKCLQRDRANRYLTGTELANDLRALRGGATSLSASAPMMAARPVSGVSSGMSAGYAGTGTLLAAPPGSLSPSVSLIPSAPAHKRPVGVLVAVGALVVIALSVGGWFAMRGGASQTQAQVQGSTGVPHAAVHAPVVAEPTPAAPTPGVQLAVPAVPAPPTPVAINAVAEETPAEAAPRSGRRSRRGSHGNRDRTRQRPNNRQIAGGGTSDYD